jgi:hypothetical protein
MEEETREEEGALTRGGLHSVFGLWRITRAVSDRIRQTASSGDLHASLLSTYETVIEQHAAAATTADPVAESRAAAAFLHNLAVGDRHRERSLWTLAKASQRVLRMPVAPARRQRGHSAG